MRIRTTIQPGDIGALVRMHGLVYSRECNLDLTMYIRAWGLPLHSTYGPTAETGGLPKHGARVVYRNASADDLPAEQDDRPGPPLPGPGEQPVTERPGTPAPRGM